MLVLLLNFGIISCRFDAVLLSELFWTVLLQVNAGFWLFATISGYLRPIDPRSYPASPPLLR